MKKLALYFLFGALAFGGTPARGEVLGALGANMVFESSADGRRYETRLPISVRGGYRFDIADAFVEYTNFRTTSGTSMLYVYREHQEFLLWGRKIFRKDWPVAPYVGVGVGFEYDRVTTTFGPERADDAGDPLAMIAAAAGARVAIIENLDLQIEARLSAASDYRPNPLFGAGLVLGFSF